MPSTSISHFERRKPFSINEKRRESVVPDGVSIDRKSVPIKSVKAGQKFLFTDHINVEYFQTHVLNQSITLYDSGPKKNVKPGTIFLVVDKDQQKMKLRFQFIGIDDQLGKVVTTDVEMMLYFRRNPDLLVDTCFQAIKRDIGNKFQQDQRRMDAIEKDANKKSATQRDIERDFRYFSRL